MTAADPEAVSWLRVFLAFAVVAGLMGLMGFALKHIGQRGMRIPGLRKEMRRMAILESLPLDARRRLVIMRCDNKEHLLLLGANQDIVIESNLSDSSVTPFRTKSSA